MSATGASPPSTHGLQASVQARALRRDLRRAITLMDLPRRGLARAILTGAAGLASAVALAACSAWLIARASQMPPVMHLTVATVAVRTFGISRGLMRYLERLASHDVALRGVGNLRVALYTGLARGRTETLARLRRGDLLARTGADVDDVGDVVVRAILPLVVAAIVGVGTVGVVGWLSPRAALVLAICLLLNATIVPLLSIRTDRDVEARRLAARAEIHSASVMLTEQSADLLTSGRHARVLDDLASSEAELERAHSEAGRPLGWAAGLSAANIGISVIAALVIGITETLAGSLSPVALAVVVLTPLAAFEGTAALPAAATQLRRSSIAAHRIMSLIDASEPEPHAAADGAPESYPESDGGAELDARSPEARVPAQSRLAAHRLAAGWPGSDVVISEVEIDLRPGRSLALVGPSGVGKTTLLLTLAGMLPPRWGHVEVGGLEPYSLVGSARAAHVALTAEDAHIFDTSVLENVRVARGDVGPDEARQALQRAGLESWLAALPDGLETVLGPDGAEISGGERRRLLLARALVSPAPLLLLDEPGEHLDAEVADRIVRDLLTTPGQGRSVVVVTHRIDPLDAADEIMVLGQDEGGGLTRVVARGTHAELLDHPAYQALGRAPSTTPRLVAPRSSA